MRDERSSSAKSSDFAQRASSDAVGGHGER